MLVSPQRPPRRAPPAAPPGAGGSLQALARSGRRRGGWCIAWALATALATGLAPQVAEASSATLQRSLQNIALAPLDAVLAPVVAGRAIARGLEQAPDPVWVKAAFVLPGFLWNCGVQGFGAGVREVAGLLELLPGLARLAFDAGERDTTPLFDPAERGPALYEAKLPGFELRLGVDYSAS